MRKLGQYFLTCTWVKDALLDAARMNQRDTVLEIGPGHGELTYALASRAERVIAVEKDKNLALFLAGECNRRRMEHVEIIADDIRALMQTHRWQSLVQDTIIIGNVPYYLTSFLFRALLSGARKPKKIVFTIQKEVAERVCAQPPRMNILAIAVQAFGNPKIICFVPRSCFSPAPRVDSAVLAVSDISDEFFQKNSLNQEEFFAIIKKAFSVRRKTLANALFPSFEKEIVQKILVKLKLPNTVRAEALSLSEWTSFILSLTHASNTLKSAPSHIPR